jgi:hypothetical protein
VSRTWVVISIVAILLFGLIAWAAASAEVVERGLRLEDGTPVVRIRFFDLFTMKALSESKPSSDDANSLLLAMLSGVSLLAAVLVARSGRASGRLRYFFPVAFLGFGWLSVDELLELNESVGSNLSWGDHLDVISYAPLALIFLWFFRDIVLSSRTALWLCAAAVALAVASAGLDALQTGTGPEEKMEALASLVLVAAFIVLSIEQLSRIPHPAREG